MQPIAPKHQTYGWGHIKPREQHTSLKKLFSYLKAQLHLPGLQYFRKHELPIIDTQEKTCSAITTNIMHPFHWIRVNCSQKLQSANFICERKSNMVHPNTLSMHIITHSYMCTKIGLFVNMSCISLHRINGTSMKFKNSKEIKVGIERYITAWTIMGIHKQTSVDSSIDILFRINEHNNSDCTCYKSISLFFQNPKVWQYKPCSCKAEYKYQLEMQLPIPLSIECKDFEFTCSDGTCILQIYVCDGIFECHDGTDEQKCHDICTTNQDCNKCISPNCFCDQLHLQCVPGGCLSLSRMCDGIADCPDASDELLCFKILSYMNNEKIIHRVDCPNGWSLCNIFEENCYPNIRICVFERNIGE